MSFLGKVILITGGGSGIGASVSAHFAKLGASVVIVDKDQKRLYDVFEKLKKNHSNTLPILGDVTKDANRIVDETIKHFGKLNVLVNNAGILIRDTMDTVNLSQFDRVFDVNVRSIIRLTNLCVPYLEKTKGNVVNVSSISGFKPVKSLLSYSISKAALDQFTKCASLDLIKKGIRVNSVNPVTIRTPLFELAGWSKEEFEVWCEERETSIPIGRLGELSDTNEAVSFLADDKTAGFLTGVLLPVDGGCMVAGTY